MESFSESLAASAAPPALPLSLLPSSLSSGVANCLVVARRDEESPRRMGRVGSTLVADDGIRAAVAGAARALRASRDRSREQPTRELDLFEEAGKEASAATSALGAAATRRASIASFCFFRRSRKAERVAVGRVLTLSLFFFEKRS